MNATMNPPPETEEENPIQVPAAATDESEFLHIQFPGLNGGGD